MHSDEHSLGVPPSTALVEYHPPHELVQLLDFQLPNGGQGKEGLLSTLERIRALQDRGASAGDEGD